MYTKLEINSLVNFLESEYFNNYLTSDEFVSLCVFDIDGVFFGGLDDIHTFTSNIPSPELEAMQKIATTDSAIWIFTDRNRFGYWGRYRNQLRKVIAHPDSDLKVRRFRNSEAFIKKFDFTKDRRALIFNAQKTSIYAEHVLKIADMNYERIIYFAGQDVPFIFRDESILKKLSKEEDTSKITLVSVKR